jgi:tripartite-type tricarboxylate transporter receptor subunit TctC
MRTVLALLLSAAVPALAQQPYPSKPMRLLIPQAPGAGVDVILRRAADDLLPRLGQPLVVENRPGGNQVLVAEMCSKGGADGHVLCTLSRDAMAINPALFAKLPYDPARDFKPVTNLYYLLSGLFAKASMPGSSVRDLQALAAAKPGALNWGTLGPRTSTDISRMWLGSVWNTSFAGIPYKGGPPIFVALVAGEIDVTVQGVYGALELMKAGKVKLLAINASKRSPRLPDVPTMAEAGIGELPTGTWWGLLMASTVPDTNVRRLNAEVVRLFREPKFVDFLDSLMLESSAGTPEEFAAVIRADRERYATLVKQFNIEKE